MNASLGMDLIRSLFATIDKAVYGLIKVLYDILLQLAETNIFTNENIQEFSTRIYVFLGIIMLFKVTFSLIQYLINPESMSDKTNGTSNLAKNVIITLFLIIIVPYGFDLLYSAQSAIIKDNLIPRLILGTEEDSIDNLNIIIDNNQCTNVRNPIDNNGDYIALMTLRPFYQVYKGQTLNDAAKQVFCSAKSTDDLLLDEIYNAETGIGNSGQYIVDYSFFLSTACGILVMLLLLEFCFDVAMRCIKLGFLEIFAPVAIISFVDPKSSKSGTFSKWLKEVFGTWARLFIRLIILFFAIYIIKIVNENVGDYAKNGIWVMLFLIIGALLFAKKAVPLIEDLLGIKFDHSIQLNPFKKIQDQALFGKQVAAFPGKATSGLAATGMSVAGSIASRNAAKVKFQKDMAEAQQKDEDALRQKMKELTIKKTTGQITSADWMRQVKSLKHETPNQDKIQKEFDSKFSNKHPLMAGIVSAHRAGSEAVKVDPKSIEDIIKAAKQAAVNSAKERTYTDNYTLKDRMSNFLTDIADIKKSGTANIVDSRIKELNEQLTNVTNALDSLRQSQGSFPPGTFAYNTATGEISLAAGVTDERAKENIRQTRELQKTMKDLNSEIKAQTKILEQQRGGQKK